MHIGSYIDLVSNAMSLDSREKSSPYTSPALNSYVSPFRGAANALRILLTAIFSATVSAATQPRLSAEDAASTWNCSARTGCAVSDQMVLYEKIDVIRVRLEKFGKRFGEARTNRNDTDCRSSGSLSG